MDYNSLKKRIPGIGSILGGHQEGEKIVRETLERLSQDKDIMLMVITPGWKKLAEEYHEMINQLREYAWWLCSDVDKHEREIQRTKDLANAADIFINMAEDKMKEQEIAFNELKKNQGTDRE